MVGSAVYFFLVCTRVMVFVLVGGLGGFVFALMLFVGYLLMLKGVCFGVYCWVFWCWADTYVWVCLDLVWASSFSWFGGVVSWCFSCDWRCCLHTVLGVVIGFARCYF